MLPDPALLGGPWAVSLATFGVCFVSGLVPLVHSEAYLVSLSLVSSAAFPVHVVLAASFGQMTAKLILYLAGRGVLKLPWKRKDQGQGGGDTLEKVRQKLERWRGGSWAFVLLSSFTGLPPFYLVSVLTGVLKLPVMTLLVPGTIGRIGRFSLVFLSPQLVRGMLPAS